MAPRGINAALADINVLWPFHIPIYIPRIFSDGIRKSLVGLRVIPPRHSRPELKDGPHDEQAADNASRTTEKPSHFVLFRFPMNFVTAPLIADLFLLAILAIGREEVKAGTLGAYHIVPYDIMIFFITLAYIAISIDASGLIRYLAFRVLQWGGKVGHRLFFYLYAFFFVLGTFIGNDPIILSGTAFLAYMTRVSSNIVHPRAWIHTQFAIANIASATLVSSNPTNLVLAGAFQIKFIVYTANMIVPVVVTAVVLFPFLLYIVFANESLIPASIKMHELPEEAKAKKPVNPNIPHARGHVEEEEDEHVNDAQGKLLSLEEIMNPFLDKGGAAFGGVVMAATLVTVLALNAASTSSGEHPVFYVTLPGAFVMFCWDVAFGWYHREDTRKIAERGRNEVEYARAERAIREQDEAQRAAERAASPEGTAMYGLGLTPIASPEPLPRSSDEDGSNTVPNDDDKSAPVAESTSSPSLKPASIHHPPVPALFVTEKSDGVTLMADAQLASSVELHPLSADNNDLQPSSPRNTMERERMEREQQEFEERVNREVARRKERGPTTLVSLASDAYRWLQDTFPTVTAVVSHLPFALVPFAFAMFVLVQALVTKGWVPVFAYGWDHWVNRTGTVGAIGGMGFLSVVLCNVRLCSSPAIVQRLY